jgi:hypothetical protein
MNFGNTLKMAAAEDESFMPAAKLAPDERLEWVPLSLTLVEYPQGNYFNKHACVSRVISSYFTNITNIRASR